MSESKNEGATVTDESKNDKATATNAEGTEFSFQAEVQQVLKLVIDSLYANREVFLRELISNASDALDKAKFTSMTRDDVDDVGELAIDIRLDDEGRTLTIEDNGIGMTRDEVINNLGTIAKSGSLEFLKQHADAKSKNDDAALNLIGQFGVGFYAAFMVASRVDVQTKSLLPDSEPVLWRSDGSGKFTVVGGERDKPGTSITLHLKEEHREYAKAWRVREIIKKYSDFVSFPIRVGGEVENQSAALWAMPKSQVTDEQHKEFFHHVTGGMDGDEPLLTVHYSIEAPVQFHALLYIPKKAPFDLFRQDRRSLRLYAKRVLIMENCEQLTPIYLRFLRGVVDSEDLSLNVSREMLQESRTLGQIEQQVVKQTLKKLASLAADDPDAYRTFWKEFGRVLKEGISIDFKNRDAIADLCRFESLNTAPGEVISLKNYIDEMPSDQKDIYYMTGPSRAAVESSPHLETFKKKGYNVLLMVDAIDEWVVQALTDYDKRKLQSVVHGDIDLGDDEEKPEEKKDEPTDALGAIKKALQSKVKDVRFSKRLTDSASCLVAETGDPGANFQRIMKMVDDRTHETKRILEVNPNHPILQNINALVAKDADDARIGTFSQLLYDQALLSEGVVEDPATLVKRMQDLLTQVSASAARDSSAAKG